MRAAVLGLLLIVTAAFAVPAAPLREVKSVEVVSLRSIAGWLRQHGANGYLGADVADAMGITRSEDGSALEAKQRGFRNDRVLRIAQILSDDKRDYVLFMVQDPDGQVYFYLSTVREGLKKALVSIPGKNVVAPLEPVEAESSFRNEVLYWEDKAATQ